MSTTRISKQEYTVRYIVVKEIRVEALSLKSAINEAERKLDTRGTLHSVVKGRGSPL